MSTQKPTIQYAFSQTEPGLVLVGKSKIGICFLSLGENRNSLLEDLKSRFPNTLLSPAGTDFDKSLKTIVSYINNNANTFDQDLDLRGTVFQKLVWKELTTIPLGTTIPYSELADRIGRPESVRAVANACGANPVGIIIPCHRVIRLDGSLGGYRGGIEKKKILLEREQTHEQ